MFSVTHFRTEFIHQGQATIMRKVTMTQFMLVIILTAMGVGLFKAPFWFAPFFMITGYVAGYTHNGEILLKRIAASLTVWGRGVAGYPRIVNIQREWDSVRVAAERQQMNGLFPTTVVVQ